MVTLFKGMKLITSAKNAVIDDALIIVQGDKIARVGKAGHTEAPSDARAVDLEGKTVLPGFIDAHVHSVMDASGDSFGPTEEDPVVTVLKASGNLEKTLQAGVTWIRDLGGKNYLDLGLRQAVKEKLINGPRMQVAGKVITMTGGHCHNIGREADGPAEVRKAAREQLKAGVDLIKVMATGGVVTKGVEPGSPQLGLEEIRALVEEAHKAGKKVAAHAQGTAGIKNAVLAGVDSVEHGIYLDEETVDLMVQKGVYLVPTLSAPFWVIKAGAEKGIPSYIIEKSSITIKSHYPSFRMAREANVKIAMGTDSGVPCIEHGGNLYELKLMVDEGMTPLEAITAATRGSAELMGVDRDFGSVEEGKIADLVVLDGDPLEDIEALFQVNAVYKAGVRVTPVSNRC